MADVPQKPNIYEVIYLNNIAVITRYLGIIFLNNYSKTYEGKVNWATYLMLGQTAKKYLNIRDSSRNETARQPELATQKTLKAALEATLKNVYLNGKLTA